MASYFLRDFLCTSSLHPPRRWPTMVQMLKKSQLTKAEWAHEVRLLRREASKAWKEFCMLQRMLNGAKRFAL